MAKPITGGALLRRARKRAGLTQANIADMLNVNVMTVSRVERNKQASSDGLRKRWMAWCALELEAHT